jgi:hypothetical protein
MGYSAYIAVGLLLANLGPVVARRVCRLVTHSDSAVLRPREPGPQVPRAKRGRRPQPCRNAGGGGRVMFPGGGLT